MLSLAVLSLVFLPCCGQENPKLSSMTTTDSRQSFRAALVFDVGGRGDKSFNDAAYEGFIQARAAIGAEEKDFKYLEPSGAIDREAALRGFAEQGFDVVVGVGILFSEAIFRTAPAFPRTTFVCVDYDPAGRAAMPKNLIGLAYREHEGCFLVGAIAALTTKTDKVGFIGGMQIPLIEKFAAGYAAGARAVNPDVVVLVAYAGQTPEAFADPARGKELARTQFQQGADIIFHASGSTGLGVFEAAKELGKLVIGVDKDQYADAPGHVLTSMFKRVDLSVKNTIIEVAQGKKTGGLRQFGLAESAVGYVHDDNNNDLIAPVVRERVESLRTKIISGEVKVPSATR
jgi:basic membrane protein A